MVYFKYVGTGKPGYSEEIGRVVSAHKYGYIEIRAPVMMKRFYIAIH